MLGCPKKMWQMKEFLGNLKRENATGTFIFNMKKL